MFRQVKSHAGSIFKLFELHSAFDFPFDRFAITDNRACAEVCNIRAKRNDHVQKICKILQFHKDAIVAFFFKHERRIFRIHRQLETTSGISLPDALAGLIRDSNILDRQVRFSLKNDTNNCCWRSCKDPNHNK